MTQVADTPVVIGYDGSDRAKDAIAEAASLFPGQRALVLSICRSAADVAPAALGAASADVIGMAVERLDEAARAGAEKLAKEGAELAKQAGLEAEARAEVTRGSTWVALRDVADEKRARAVVVGARGLSPLKELILGSTSAGLAHHCRRPVLIVRGEQERSSRGEASR